MKIDLRRLTKEFHTLRGRVVAVDGVDLTVEEGEFFVLLGPSGSGKSTLLNLVAGLEKPSGGELGFGDEVVAAPQRGIFIPPRQRGVAMVFQSYALYPHLDVFDNIAFPLRIAGTKKEEIRPAVERAARALDISELLRARPGELSGGQRQRVAIARAIVRRPRVLLLDEPLSNLDMQLRTSTRAELKRLQRELAVTTVYVTHDQTEAMTLGDRIAVLRGGRVEQVGSAGDLYHRPASAFIGGFIGAPQMNILPARVSGEGEGGHWQIGGRHLSLPAGVLGQAVKAASLGIRPEHIETNPPGAGGLDGVVETAEPMGRETLLHVRIGADLLRVLVAGDREALGPRISLGIDPGRLYCFDEEGKSL